MNTRMMLSGVLAVPALGIAGLVHGHHSDAVYDRDRVVGFEAEATRYAFRNPHVTIFVEAEEPGGQAVEWEIETGSTPIMQRSGWSNRGASSRMLVESLEGGGGITRESFVELVKGVIEEIRADTTNEMNVMAAQYTGDFSWIEVQKQTLTQLQAMVTLLEQINNKDGGIPTDGQ